MALQNLGDLGDGHKVRRFLFQRIESDRHDGIGGIDEDQAVTQMTVFPALPCVDSPQKKWRRVAMKIEVDETSVLLDILFAHVAQQIAFAAARLADHNHMPHALATRERHSAARWPSVYDPISEIQTSTARPCFASPQGKAIPNRCDDLFEKIDHGEIVRGGSAILVTAEPKGTYDANVKVGKCRLRIRRQEPRQSLGTTSATRAPR